ncbi:hypothetical protein BACOVA_03641 [Bacteroides ovatus ATCC 8483]|uniref:Uncharacterized protein n=1 Tax=Bacteroides ovatus (strain ATCC 8483 / DSM 1896 / JCM 5824 / BCRC 10623 / CCUG 4943 / NCTC 11153) TaxID=411476 RepID=A0AAN3A787_BACO1|nr:hypothetical protein BACOVA_03641 [Bacteroides ovatus ATCC 8483]
MGDVCDKTGRTGAAIAAPIIHVRWYIILGVVFMNTKIAFNF